MTAKCNMDIGNPRAGIVVAERLVGDRIVRFESVSSTNEKAKEMLGEGVEAGTVVVADRQSEGRGRYGRAWFSPPGGLYLSIVLSPAERNVQLLSPLSGLPVARMLKDRGVDAALKWPNDVIVGGKKIGGILCEGVHRGGAFYAIVGIGLNTMTDMHRLPPDVRESATTLRKELDHELDNSDFLERLLNRFDEFYASYVAGDFATLLARYSLLCTTIGKHVTIETARGRATGLAVAVSSSGALILESGSKRTEVFEGTVLKTEP